jgi:hypothetical protein
VSGPGDPPERAAREERVDSVIRDVMGQPRMLGGVTLGRLVRSWDRVVGPALARETAPVALSRGELVVGASGPAWAAQARFLTAEIRRRANEELGGDAIGSVRVVVRPEASRTGPESLRRKGSGMSPGDGKLR